MVAPVVVSLSVAATSPFYKEIVKRILELLSREVGLIWNLEADLRSMRRQFETIQAALEDSEGGSSHMKQPHLLHNWLKNIKGISGDVEDLLDDMSMVLDRYLGSKGSRIPRNPIGRKLFYYMLNCNPMKMVVKGQMGRRMKEIREMIDEINTTHKALVPLARHISEDKVLTFTTRHVSVGKPFVFGRDEEKNDIMKVLLNTSESSEFFPFVVAIVGIGGLGKTTFADLIYNDSMIQGKRKFDEIVWISVSFEFNLESIIRTIFKTVSDLEFHGDQQALFQRTRDVLKEKKLFLVMDDVWNEDREKWDKFVSVMEECNRESKILVTTRSRKVAKIIQAAVIHDLKTLSLEDSWTLLCRKAFDEGEETEFPRFRKIGEEILEKCNGIPLAINAIGAILYGSKREDYWRGIRDSEIWKLEEKFQLDDEQRVMSSLRLTYLKMPLELRRCYSFCSFYPKDFKIHQRDLMHQWITLGFIGGDNKNVPIEEIAELYVENLFWVGFIRNLKQEDSITGKVQFKMHDLAHDLAQSITEEEVKICTSQDLYDVPRTCRYVYSHGKQEQPKIHKNMMGKLRALRIEDSTLLVKADGIECLRMLIIRDDLAMELPTSLRSLKHLTYLDVYNQKGWKMPGYIGDLSNLKYLRFSCSSSPKTKGDRNPSKCLKMANCWWIPAASELQHVVPESIGKLENLQVLDISSFPSLNYLPKTLGKLKSLKTLDMSFCGKLVSLPNSIGELKNLKILKLKRCSNIETLPPSIFDLTCLETLDISFCSKLRDLPQGIGRLMNLKHLINNNCPLKGMPSGIRELIKLSQLGLFSIGKSDGTHAEIAEMEHLNEICGDMDITGIQNVTDAKKANLSQKNHLRYLSLDWKTDLDDEIDMLTPGEAETALKGLLPPEQLEWLVIRNYPGNYPGGRDSFWMDELGTWLPRLVRVSLENFTSCTAVPTFGHLKHLRDLEICGMENLEGIGDEFYGVEDPNLPFPALQELTFRNMPKLGEWLTAHKVTDHCGGRNKFLFPCLAELKIENCPLLQPTPCFPPVDDRITISHSFDEAEENFKLTKQRNTSHMILVVTYKGNSEGKLFEYRNWNRNWKEHQTVMIKNWENLLTELPELTVSVQSLTFSRCNLLPRFQENFVVNVTSLRRLDINLCKDLEQLSAWLQNLLSLETLTISGCENLEQLPNVLGNVTSLQYLKITFCTELSSLPDGLGNLCSLRQLSISHCHKLTELPNSLGNLTSLQQLELSSFRQPTTLPDWLQNLQQLDRLNITDWNNLETLPDFIADMPSLKGLMLSNCPKLNPQVLRIPRSLTWLYIRGCGPELQKWYQTSARFET